MNRIEKAKHVAEKESNVINDVIDDAAEKATDLIEEAKDRSERWAGRIRERGSDLLDEVQGRGQNTWKNTKGWIGKNPGAAIGWAFLAGAVLYAIFEKRES